MGKVNQAYKSLVLGKSEYSALKQLQRWRHTNEQQTLVFRQIMLRPTENRTTFHFAMNCVCIHFKDSIDSYMFLNEERCTWATWPTMIYVQFQEIHTARKKPIYIYIYSFLGIPIFKWKGVYTGIKCFTDYRPKLFINSKYTL